MSFFGMFGGGNGCDGGEEKNCECNKLLKDHLKKCAGLGERPPLVEGCKAAKDMDPCAANDLSGPPTCKGKTEAPKCCAPAPPKIVVFVPKCTVPPTATFKCPADCCEPPKAKAKCCQPPPPNKCCNDGASKCPEIVTSDGKKVNSGPCPASGGSSGCAKPKPITGSEGASAGACGGNNNSCEARPLYMEPKKC